MQKIFITFSNFSLSLYKDIFARYNQVFCCACKILYLNIYGIYNTNNLAQLCPLAHVCVWCMFIIIICIFAHTPLIIICATSPYIRRVYISFTYHINNKSRRGSNWSELRQVQSCLYMANNNNNNIFGAMAPLHAPIK